MATKSLLINFAGYPYDMLNLLPDNGLANLASCLIDAGHSTCIWDFFSIDMMEKLFPEGEKEKLNTLRQKIYHQLKIGRKPYETDLADLKNLKQIINRYQEREIYRLGERLAQYVKKDSLDFVGFKLWTGAGFYGSILLAKEIKRINPNVKVFGGGPHVDLFMSLCFDETQIFDILAYGECEEVIIQLAEYVEGKRHITEISNAIYLENRKPKINKKINKLDLNSIPLPVYDENVYPAMSGNNKIKIFLVDESRGCPNNCNFCIHPRKSGKIRRTVSAEVFVDRIEQLKKRYSLKAFRFAGSNPPADLRRGIAQELIKRNVKVSFSGFSHIRNSKLEDFYLLKKAGCCALTFGVESGSQLILDEAMNKKISVEDIKKCFLMCHNSKIAAIASIIMPAPFETEETKKQTSKLLLEIKPESVIVSFPWMMMGTKWHVERENFGFEIQDIKTLFRRVMTYSLNPFVSPFIWDNVADYKLNGKPYMYILDEQNEFSRQLNQAGLSTNIFDPFFLYAKFSEMTAVHLRNYSNECIMKGEFGALRCIVSKINQRVFM